MATFINAEKKGHFWVKDPDGGISTGTVDQIKQLNLQPATQEEVNKTLEYEKNAEKYEGIGGSLRAAGESAIGSIPIIGSKILETAGVSEEQQRVREEVSPISSFIGSSGSEIAQIAAITALTGGVGTALGVGRLSLGASKIARLARYATPVVRGGLEGAYIGLAESENRRIQEGRQKGDTNIANDILSGAAWGGGLSLLGALGGRGINALFGKTNVGKAINEELIHTYGGTRGTNGLLKRQNQVLKETDPLLRTQLKREINTFRKEIINIDNTSLDNLRDRLAFNNVENFSRTKGTYVFEGTPVEDIVYKYGNNNKYGFLFSQLAQNELLRRNSVKSLSIGLKSLTEGAGKYSGPIGALSAIGDIGFSIAAVPLGGVGYIVGKGIAKIAGLAIDTKIGQKASEMGANAIKNLIVGGSRLSPLSKTAKLTSLSYISRITEDNYEEINDLVNNPIPPEKRVEEFMNNGLQPIVASHIVTKQDLVLQLLNEALPKIKNPAPETLAKANRYIDAIVNPEGMLKRMNNLQLTREDVNVLAVQSPEVLQELRDLIKEQYNNGVVFYPEQREQHELIISVGIKVAEIQKNYNIKQKPDNTQAKIADAFNTQMTNLEV